MKIAQAEFVLSAAKSAQFPSDGLPQIAFAGRSNVGKSSLLNALLNRKRLARTSNTPGKTRTINYYRVNKTFYFVDLPGYGFARVAKKMQSDWKALIESYLKASIDLRAVMVVLDLRHPLSPLDLELFDWLLRTRLTALAIGTKADKLPSSRRKRQIIDLGAALAPLNVPPPIPFSASKRIGVDSVWKSISPLLFEPSMD